MSKSLYTLPAEWALQSGIMLTWPHEDTDWKPYLSEITDTFVELAKTIATYERLIIATPHANDVRKLLSESAIPDADMRRIAIYSCPSNDTWARDHGAITLVNPLASVGSNERYRLLDFQFNGWGNKFAAEKDNNITRNLYWKGAFKGELSDNNDFVLEGGSIESDGKGTILTTSSCLLAPHRNQPLTKAEIEQQLLNRLCAKRIVWLDYGMLIGDDTDGHVDTIVRFAPNDTLLYVGCDDVRDAQYQDFMHLKQQLQDLRTMEGTPYNLIELPMPYPIYDDDERLPATYANFLIINGAIIVPTYRQPDLDRKAQALIATAFPNKKIIGIDSTTIIRQHGSIHCLTMQFPEGVLAG